MLNAPLAIIVTLRPRVSVMTGLKLGMPNLGPLTALRQIVPAWLLTSDVTSWTLLFRVKCILMLTWVNARPNRSNALLQRNDASMTPLFVLIRPSNVRHRVVTFDVVVMVVAFFLSVVTCLLKIEAAGPSRWAQTPFVLCRVKWVVFRLVSLKIQDAARQTGSVCELAMGLGRRFVRIRSALNWQPPGATPCRPPAIKKLDSEGSWTALPAYMERPYLVELVVYVYYIYGYYIVERLVAWVAARAYRSYPSAWTRPSRRKHSGPPEPHVCCGTPPRKNSPSGWNPVR